MKLKIYDEPVKHYIIDDMVTDKFNSKILENVISLIPKMEDGIIGAFGIPIYQPKFKNNKNRWLEESDELYRIMEETAHTLYLNLKRKGTMLLSMYQEGGLYSWHKDTTNSMTLNYMLSTSPQKFEGGDFILGNLEDIVHNKIIEFKNNRAIIFPSKAWHCVTPVKNFTGDPIDSRFTIQYWETGHERKVY